MRIITIKDCRNCKTYKSRIKLVLLIQPIIIIISMIIIIMFDNYGIILTLFNFIIFIGLLFLPYRNVCSQCDNAKIQYIVT